MPEVKFCGMTREDDVHEAARLGARYVGFIMTESPRSIAPIRAAQLRSVLEGTGVRTVGVFGDESVEDILLAASLAGVEIVQLHGRTAVRQPARVEAEHHQVSAAVSRLRAELGAEIWRVIRVGANGLSEEDRSASGGGDGILLDTLATRGILGGTGVAFDWDRVAADAQALRMGRRLIVAGGLRPENVRLAIDRLSPDVVDVSSGVEQTPGVKDHHRMAAFMSSVVSTTPETNQ